MQNTQNKVIRKYDTWTTREVVMNVDKRLLNDGQKRFVHWVENLVKGGWVIDLIVPVIQRYTWECGHLAVQIVEQLARDIVEALWM